MCPLGKSYPGSEKSISLFEASLSLLPTVSRYSLVKSFLRIFNSLPYRGFSVAGSLFFAVG